VRTAAARAFASASAGITHVVAATGRSLISIFAIPLFSHFATPFDR
jgi:hypothetical protein